MTIGQLSLCPGATYPLTHFLCLCLLKSYLTFILSLLFVSFQSHHGHLAGLKVLIRLYNNLNVKGINGKSFIQKVLFFWHMRHSYLSFCHLHKHANHIVARKESVVVCNQRWKLCFLAFHRGTSHRLESLNRCKVGAKFYDPFLWIKLLERP